MRILWTLLPATIICGATRGIGAQTTSDSATAANAVPHFSDSAMLSAWGPLPAGTPREERVRTYHIQHQIIHVRFDWSRHAVIGVTTIRVAPLDTALRDVALDAVGMTIDSVTTGEGLSGAPLKYSSDSAKLVVHLATPVQRGDSATFTISYETVNPKQGAYFIDRRHALWTQGETETNRYWVPTYDFPNDKTTWEIYVRVPKKEKALSNGRLVDTTAVGDDMEWHWSLEKPASTYLMTVATGDYAVLRDKWRSVPVDYWVYPDSTAAGWRGFGATPKAMEIYAKKLGVPYPWVKYDQIVAPSFIYGGMENVTATTQNDFEILHPAWSEPERNSEGLVAHELAHQWFGDYLTTRDWGDVWLNEGFATFMEQVYQEVAHGPDALAMERLGAQGETIGADRRSRRPIVYSRWEHDPIEVFFSGHIYPKGAYVLHALRHMLGDKVFWGAMHRYIVDHALSNVVSADLEHAFEQQSGRDLSTFFKQWVYGAGFPILQVSTTYDSTARTVTFTARQVQPRDTLTGFFDADVDVAVFTTKGVVRGVVPLHGEVSTATFKVASAPLAYRWDNGRWLLQLFDFPRSSAMLAYDLLHDEDVTGRLEAEGLLRERAGDRTAMHAFAQAAVHDAFWAAREEAATALAGFPSDSSLRAVLLTASKDADSRVRSAAARSLRRFPGAASEERLKVLAMDPSLFVRGDALFALATLDSSAALPLIEAASQRSSWGDEERHNAQAALSVFRKPGNP